MRRVAITHTGTSTNPVRSTRLGIAKQIEGWRHCSEVEFDKKKKVRLALCTKIDGPATDLSRPLKKLPGLYLDGFRLPMDDHNQIVSGRALGTDVGGKPKRVQLRQGKHFTESSSLLMG